MRFVPDGAVVPVFSGPLRGAKWTVSRTTPEALGYVGGWYERHLQEAIAERLLSSTVAYDLGAHHGFYSLLFAQACSIVVAVEPDATNCDAILRNSTINDRSIIDDRSIYIVRGGVADQHGTATFCRLSDDDQYGWVELIEEYDGAVPSGCLRHPVMMWTVDELADRYGAPNYIKADIEGAEHRMLLGAHQVLAATKPTIFLSVHGPRQEWRCRQVLEQHGYRITALRAHDILIAEHPGWSRSGV